MTRYSRLNGRFFLFLDVLLCCMGDGFYVYAAPGWSGPLSLEAAEREALSL